MTTGGSRYKKDRRIQVYVPLDLKQRLGILPARSISRICQDALTRAVEQAERERDGQLADMLAED